MKLKERERFNRKYHPGERGTLYISGMLKQKIKAGGMKINICERCQQNRQKLFYETLDDKKRETVLPDPKEATSGRRKLVMMVNLLAGIMGRKLYNHLERNELLTDEQE